MQRLLDISEQELTNEPAYANTKTLPNVFYPTEASVVLDIGGENRVFGKCARAVYYRMTGQPHTKPKQERSERIFGYGKYFERNEIELYKKAGIYDSNNVKFSAQIPDSDSYVSGEVDAIVRLDGKYVGVEFKTSYGSHFVRQNIIGYKRKGKSTNLDYILDDLLPAPKIEHILQVMLYMDYYRNFGIDEFRIIYSARDSMDMAEYRLTLEERADHKRYVVVEKLERDGRIIDIPIVRISTDDIYDRYRYIRDYIMRNVAPPPDYDVTGTSDWQCSYCNFRDTCIKAVNSVDVK